MAAEGYANDLLPVVTLLGAGVVAVPIFKRIGLGSVLGYLAAGLVIGPFGLGLFADPAAILHVAELGVVMFLFIIGLEMQPSRLWGLRRAIFGLGALQVGLCGLLLTGAGMLSGLPPAVAFIAAMGFVMTSTAIVMQILDEQGQTSTPRGQRMVAILLLEDLAIVPLLALVAILAPTSGEAAHGSHWASIGIALASLLALIAAGRWLLNPMFGILARARAREVMTAAALLVVLGAALAMDLGGLSMALGAFTAGVLLSESSFRHELEADIEPFRGILLGLFFMGVGMSLDLAVLTQDWPMILLGVTVYMTLKAAGIYGIARLLKAGHAEAVHRTTVMAQGGEFAFVLYGAAVGVGLFEPRLGAALTAIVILSMALTPLIVLATAGAGSEALDVSMDGIDEADGLEGDILIIGFGRFAQVASQGLLARGFNVSIIENDVEMIRVAATFGFKVYYGDGGRLDILHASGAESARAVLVCVDDRAAANRIVELIKAEFGQAKLFVRAFDRGHSLELIGHKVDYEIRETFESALAMSGAALVALDVPEEDAQAILEDVRRRDAERLALQVTGGLSAGRDLMHGNRPVPAPLTAPRRTGRGMNEGAIEAMAERADA
ncbi:monovalent cation:proton antiporter-2 (CPA2) family protein [Marinivivus vitaminiproducens]|uniref:monovalent cation:proton antiporter-2 (CPA2) family protein n=1 Tax=Marinivivus vitaminiproducens TaxID=3035935 RepID=UPI0027A9A8F5|nr:monovalent cation:proton antiporter-2 (CPA2) family protein [Geminicoccaceae bacterium SCSIO 64248]